jgi:hypothetical protein
MKLSKNLLTAALILAAASGASRAADSYYRETPVFIPYPEPGKTWNIRQYGPVGIGINLINPAFTIQISNVEKGSPAETAGKLQKGQIIESINGQTLKDIDPRVQLANILTEAETTDGKMKFKIKDQGEVVVDIPVMGRYSETWPLNCPKSAKIVRNFADNAAKSEKPDWSAGLFLLATGEENDLETIRRWVKQEVFTHNYPWYVGLRGTAVCEYYLRTGDKSVLPAINQMSESLKGSMYNGSWMGRGATTPNYKYMGGGHMNAAGVHALNFLLLARECGADVDEYLLQRVLKQFFRFAGRGNVAYGDQFPEGGFRDNGKSAALAITMSSAASLDPRGEDSIYAKARDVAAMKSFYATTWFNRAHTGGGIGEIWHGVAMQLLVDRKPVQYRSFMDERRWFYEIARRFDGRFSISDSGGSYDKQEWGDYFALAYVAPRKKLRMFGAPKTEWCQPYKLPDRPWGTPADDVFQSSTPAEHEPGKVLDISKEVIKMHASGPLMNTLGTNATDGVIWVYAHHPEYAFRSGIARNIVADGRTRLIVPLLKSKDPRVREVGVLTMAGMFKGSPLPAEQITDEMYQLLAGIINDPAESHWVAINAMKALARLPEDKIIPLVDRLLYFMGQDDWWLQSAALAPLAKVATSEGVYQKVIPAIGDLAARNTICALLGATGNEFPAKLSSAKPEVQKLALQVFTKAYNTLPDPLLAPGGANLASGLNIFQGTIRGWIQALPGGPDLMLKLPKLTSAYQLSGKASDKYVYQDHAPNPALLGKWRTMEKAGSVKELQDKWAKEAADKAAETAAKKAGKKTKPKPAPKKPSYGIPDINIQDGGIASVGRSKLTWSGNMLINVSTGEALQMNIQTIDGKEYLFVETGGFTEQDETVEESTWQPSYYVMTRSK